MRFKYFVILGIIVLTAGCLDNILSMGQTSPVLYINVTLEEIYLNDSNYFRLNETNNNTVIVRTIEAYAGEMPKMQAPLDNLADKFPAVYVRVIQSANLVNYQTGEDYRGPGTYNLVVGLKKEVNRTVPMNIFIRTINKDGDQMHRANLVFNWSGEKQSKTFK